MPTSRRVTQVRFLNLGLAVAAGGPSLRSFARVGFLCSNFSQPIQTWQFSRVAPDSAKPAGAAKPASRHRRRKSHNPAHCHSERNRPTFSSLFASERMGRPVQRGICFCLLVVLVAASLARHSVPAHQSPGAPGSLVEPGSCRCLWPYPGGAHRRPPRSNNQEVK